MAWTLHDLKKNLGGKECPGPPGSATEDKHQHFATETRVLNQRKAAPTFMLLGWGVSVLSTTTRTTTTRTKTKGKKFELAESQLKHEDTWEIEMEFGKDQINLNFELTIFGQSGTHLCPHTQHFLICRVIGLWRGTGPLGSLASWTFSECWTLHFSSNIFLIGHVLQMMLWRSVSCCWSAHVVSIPILNGSCEICDKHKYGLTS